MKLRFLFVALLLSSMALPELFAGYTQKLLVQVFDQGARPVENAQVYAEYQINAVTGTARTKPKPTAANGTVDISFTDYEELAGQTSYTYTLYAKYGSQVVSATLQAAKPPVPRVYSLQVNASYAFVKVHDQTGKPLAASVTMGNETKETDNVGGAAFHLPPGSYNVRADVNGTVRNRNITLQNDQALDIEFPRYKLSILVIDDYKRPLAAQVDLDGASQNTSDAGLVVFENVTSEQPRVTVKYKESFKKLQPSLKKENSIQVVFDLTKPIVQELHHTIQKNGEATIDAYVQEPGSAASGISSVAITYEVNGVTNALQAYTVGYNSFEAKIPVVPKDTLVKYTVRAIDKEGNAGFASGTYIIATEKTVVVKKPDEGFFGIKIGWELFIVVLLGLGVAGFGVLNYRKKQHEKKLEEETEVRMPSAEPPPMEQIPSEPPPAAPPETPPPAAPPSTVLPKVDKTDAQK